MSLYGWEAPDDGQKDCPKYVQLLLPINKNWNSAHPLVFIHKHSVLMLSSHLCLRVPSDISPLNYKTQQLYNSSYYSPVCYISCRKQLPPSSAEVKNKWTYTSTPPYSFMASIWASLISFFFTISIAVHQLAPASCLRFQTNLRHCRSTSWQIAAHKLQQHNKQLCANSKP